MFWDAMLINHLCPAADSFVEAKIHTELKLPDLSQTDQSDYVPYSDTELPGLLPSATPEQPQITPEQPPSLSSTGKPLATTQIY